MLENSAQRGRRFPASMDCGRAALLRSPDIWAEQQLGPRSLAIFCKQIPKGLRPKAQGCDAGAHAERPSINLFQFPLGKRWSKSQPQRGCVSISTISSIPIRCGVWEEAPSRNPVGVVRLCGHFTQGSSRFAGQPWALLRNPVGIQSRMHRRTGLVPPPRSKNVQTPGAERQLGPTTERSIEARVL